MESNIKNNWTVTNDGEANFYRIANGDNWLMRIQVNGELTSHQQEQIVRLIVASPESIEALKATKVLKLQNYPTGSIGYNLFNQINNVIKKATE